MRTLALTSLAIIALAVPALAQNGGDRERAGGAFMSSYSEPASQASNPRGLDVQATGSIERRRAERHR